MSEFINDRIHLLLSQRRYSDAEKLVNDLLIQSPNDSDYLRLSSHISHQLGNYDKALTLANAAISANPNSSEAYYNKCHILIELKEVKEAKTIINKAIEINPIDADNYALLAHLNFVLKDYQEALESANSALAFEPENLLALNTRSSAQLKLGDHSASFDTIEGALREDPNNANTHANYGWNLLEAGNHREALQHFSEALKLDPNSEFAQAGMMEALKARYVIYRWFLKYSFWISNLTSKNQWAVIIGFYVGYRIINSLASKYPILMPISILLMIVAFSTWVITPISNLFLRLNKFGRHLLSKNEILSSNFVGLSALIGIFGGLTFLFSGKTVGIAMAIFGLTMMVPLSTMFSTSKHKFLLPSYTVGLAALGVLSIFNTFNTGILISSLTTFYFLGFFAYQWIANFTIISRN